MPIYLYWGDDEFAIAQAVKSLKDKTLDPAWESFNYDKFAAEQPEAITQGLNQAMTPPFGLGCRFIWLAETTLCQRCSPEQLSELERTLPVIPATNVLLLTTTHKPDGRLKSTKLLEHHAEVREFALVPAWKTEQLTKHVRQLAQDLGVNLTAAAVDLLVEAVGNDTRQLYSELEKLRLYANGTSRSLDETTITTLVTATSQNALKLAAAIRQGNVGQALELVIELLGQNEPALRIVSTLVKQFRTWLWVKLMLDTGERDNGAIAKAAEVPNPKRIYFLRQEVQSLSLPTLLATLPLLLELEASLKRGAEDLQTLQTKVVELAVLCQSNAGQP